MAFAAKKALKWIKPNQTARCDFSNKIITFVFPWSRVKIHFDRLHDKLFHKIFEMFVLSTSYMHFSDDEPTLFLRLYTRYGQFHVELRCIFRENHHSTMHNPGDHCLTSCDQVTLSLTQLNLAVIYLVIWQLTICFTVLTVKNTYFQDMTNLLPLQFALMIASQFTEKSK